MGKNSKWFLTLMVSTFFVLTIHAQYYIQKLLDDELRKGIVFSIQEKNNKNEFYLDLGVFYNDAFGEKTLFYSINDNFENIKLKDFKNINQWSSSFGESIRFDGLNYYYLTRDNSTSTLSPDSVGWNFGKINQSGKLLFDVKIPFKPVSGSVYFSYGIELVKDQNVILWGIGIPPENDPNVNNPYIIWVRLNKDGTKISGPHYYKPPGVDGWAQPTDATLDIDSCIVLVYDNKVKAKEKYVLKIKDDDTVEIMMRLDLTTNYVTDAAKLDVTQSGHFLVTNYDKNYYELPVLVRVDRSNKVLWESAFEIPYGWINGVYRPIVSKIYLNRIREISNGDILVCGINHQIERFDDDSLGTEVIKSGYTGSFMARYGRDGTVKWAHFLIDPDDIGGLNKIRLNDISETEDGSILVGGELGVRNEFDRSRPFYMKLGPNGCFDDACSHVDKWWYFPKDIVSISDRDLSENRVLVYPNPGKDQITILLPEMKIKGSSYRYSVNDGRGQSHIQGMIQIDDPTIYTGFLPTGLYIITIQDNQGNIHGCKWVKE